IKILKNQVLYEKKMEDIIVVYCEGLINSDLLIDSLLPDIQRSYKLNGVKGLNTLSYSETANFVKQDPSVDQKILEKVFEGYTVILINRIVYFFNTADPPKRSPEESASEVSVKGPRDAFVEDITSNIALVRKRLKTGSMVTKSFTVGKRSN